MAGVKRSRRAVLLVALYAGYLLAVGAHGVLHPVERAGLGGAPLAIRQLGVSPDCPTPCSDPTHHHDRDARPDRCQICQFTSTLHALVPGASAAAHYAPLSSPHAFVRVDAGPAASAFAPPQSRAPPIVSA